MPATMHGDRAKPSIPRNLLRLTLPALIAVLSACGGGGGGGGSSIPATAPTTSADAYEQDDAPSLAKNISVNSAQGHNHFDDADDWISFNATAGYQYTITTSNLDIDADTTLDLYDANGNWIDYNDDYSTGWASQIIWAATSSGTYYIDVGSFGGYYGPYTGYTITVTGQALPPTPDLTSSSMTVPTSVASNGVLTFSDSVVNQGSGAAGGFYVDYYLSTNSTISSGDTYLGSRRISSLAAGATDTASSSFAVPGSLTQGATYYVGALIDTGYEVTELDETNNTSSAYALTIGAALPADLTISGVSSTASIPAGGTITVGDTVSNSGYAASGVDVYYYLSTDSIITVTDTYIGSRTISSIDTVDNVNSGLAIQLPRDFTPGSYYLGAIVDPTNTVLENNEGDNVSNVVSVSVTTAVPSDLYFSSFIPDTTVNTYNQMAITDTVSNQGSGDENGFDVSYYLSTDNIADAGDTLLGTRTIPSLAASASNTGTVNFSINWPVGTYYVYAVIDTAGNALETDTTNNTSLVATISVVSPDVSMGSTVAVSPTTALVGDSVSITDTVTNVGSADITDSFTVYYYISTDSTITTADTYLGSRTVNGLAAGANSTATVTKTISINLAANGTYYIGAIADPYNYLSDGNTTNNTSGGTAVTISGVCTPDGYEEDDSYASASAIGVGQTQSHNFCQDSNDWLSFSAVAGNTYTISTTIPSTSVSTDTVLYLYGTDGSTTLTSNDDGGSGLASLISSWTPPATGTYFIRVNSFASDTGNRQDYTVTLSAP